MLGIPTKRRVLPGMDVIAGKVRSPHPNIIDLEPRNELFARGIAEGRITQFTVLAEPHDTRAVCRFLLKMGLEVVAADNPTDARSPKFHAARRVARAPRKGDKWWFIISANPATFHQHLGGGKSAQDWEGRVELECVDVEGYEVFHLRLHSMHLITPLQPEIGPPPPEERAGNDYRTYLVDFSRVQPGRTY